MCPFFPGHTVTLEEKNDEKKSHDPNNQRIKKCTYKMKLIALKMHQQMFSN
jgi:hypothetical protein